MSGTATAELRAMRRNADKEKEEAALAQATMATIEAKAKKQYEKDLRAATKDSEERIGKWVSSEMFQIAMFHHT